MPSAYWLSGCWKDNTISDCILYNDIKIYIIADKNIFEKQFNRMQSFTLFCISRLLGMYILNIYE